MDDPILGPKLRKTSPSLIPIMRHRYFPKLWAPTAMVAFLLAAHPTPAADVTSFSVIKGEFLLQESADTLTRDPLFGFSVLGGVDLSDFNLLKSAKVRLPEGESLLLDDLGDAWSLLDSFETQAELDGAYQWGDYTVSFDSISEGSFACLIEMPETPLPPAPRLTNFEVTLGVDPGQPLTLQWDFDRPPAQNDFMQVYVNLGHAEIFATPNLGQPGALNSRDRTLTLPPNTLVPGFIHSLNLELTRIVGTNADCYPEAQGYGGVFRSTEIELFVYTPPTIRLLPASGPTLPEIEVVADPDGIVVLQSTPDFKSWINLATNTSTSGTNVFTLPPGSKAPFFLRALQR